MVDGRRAMFGLLNSGEKHAGKVSRDQVHLGKRRWRGGGVGIKIKPRFTTRIVAGTQTKKQFAAPAQHTDCGRRQEWPAQKEWQKWRCGEQ